MNHIVNKTYKEIYKEKILIERMLCHKNQVSETAPMSEYLIDWVYIIAITQDIDENYYLVLHPNMDFFWNDEYDLLEYYPEFGHVHVKISLDEAKEIIKRLNDLGNRNRIDVPYFPFLITAFKNIIPCNINFLTLIGEEGRYTPHNNSIDIASNNSQIDILITIIHEYTHYLLHNEFYNDFGKDLTNSSPSLYIDYFYNTEEILCRKVSMKVINFLFPGIPKAFLEHINSLKSLNENDVFPCHENGYHLEEFSEKLSEHISTKLEKEFDIIKNEKQLVYLEKDECYVLSEKDNAALYDIIVNKIIPKYINCNTKSK